MESDDRRGSRMTDKIFAGVTITLVGALILQLIIGIIYQSGINAAAEAERRSNKDNTILNYNKNTEQDKAIKQVEKIYITIGEIKRDNVSILNSIERLNKNSERGTEWRLKRERVIDQYIDEQRRK